jgi:hypothetical protein
VLSAVRWMQEEDRAGRLERWFGKPGGEDTSALRTARREGWVLGPG